MEDESCQQFHRSTWTFLSTGKNKLASITKSIYLNKNDENTEPVAKMQEDGIDEPKTKAQLPLKEKNDINKKAALELNQEQKQKIVVYVHNVIS